MVKNFSKICRTFGIFWNLKQFAALLGIWCTCMIYVHSPWWCKRDRNYLFRFFCYFRFFLSFCEVFHASKFFCLLLSFEKESHIEFEFSIQLWKMRTFNICIYISLTTLNIIFSLFFIRCGFSHCHWICIIFQLSF